jgi:GDP-4-dehydro-6-deoxy-D-mannose reductase
VVEAYGVLLEKGRSGEIYNVGSGKEYCIRKILVDLIQISTKAITYEGSPDKMRPVENIRIQADIRNITATTGWIPQIGIDATLRDSLVYWRAI